MTDEPYPTNNSLYDRANQQMDTWRTQGAADTERATLARLGAGLAAISGQSTYEVDGATYSTDTGAPLHTAEARPAAWQPAAQNDADDHGRAR